MIKKELNMKAEDLNGVDVEICSEEGEQRGQHEEVLNRVLEESKLILINDKISNGDKLLVILSGLLLSLSSGATLAYGESLLGVVGSILALTVIERGLSH